MEMNVQLSVSVIPHKEFLEICSNSKLERTNIMRKIDVEEKIVPLGVCTVNVQYSGQSHYLDLYVVKMGDGYCLDKGGLKSIHLGWQSIKSVQVHLSALSSSAGVSKGYWAPEEHKSQLHSDRRANPQFFKAQQEPFSIRDAAN